MTSEHTDNDLYIGLNLEYSALRDEVLKRIELRTQILFGTLALAGVLFGFASSTPVGILSYPIIAFFLAAAWSQNEIGMKRTSNFIRLQIESRVPGLSWEGYRQKNVQALTKVRGIRLATLSASGVFVGTQMVALLIGFANVASFAIFDWIVAIIAIVLTLTTTALLVAVERRVEILGR
jgi:hypothetical protein